MQSEEAPGALGTDVSGDTYWLPDDQARSLFPDR
jgi:hypothetical protein